MLNNYLIYFYQPSKESGIPNLIPQGRIVLGILTIIGLIKAIGHIIDAVTDPLIAACSDKSRHPDGRRIPLMKKTAIPFGLCALLMFFVPLGKVSGLNAAAGEMLGTGCTFKNISTDDGTCRAQAFLRCINDADFEKDLDTLREMAGRHGVQIVLRALEEPVRQIAANAGMEGSVIVEKIKRTKKPGYGYDALNDKYVDMVEAGIIDPTKVTRSALQNAASIAAMVLTTESLVCDIPAPEPAAPAPGAGGMGGMY